MRFSPQGADDSAFTSHVTVEIGHVLVQLQHGVWSLLLKVIEHHVVRVVVLKNTGLFFVLVL
jgi:hypothetical protein